MSTRDGHPYPAALRDLDPGLRWATVRELIYWRSGGQCEVCGATLHGAMEAHHRLPRRYGPDCPCNALALCGECHHDKVHGQPIESAAAGRILSSTALGAAVPDDAPAWLWVRGHGMVWVQLSCAGAYRIVPSTGPTASGTVDPDRPSREGATREGIL
jgi:hypothetical protein